MKKLIERERSEIRKRIANLELSIRGITGNSRATLLFEISKERQLLANSFTADHSGSTIDGGAPTKVIAEMIPGLPGAPDEYIYPDSMPTFNRLMDILEREEAAEINSLQLDRSPSDTDIERWALRAAVLEYYRNLGIDYEEVVSETLGDDLMKREFAPNQEDIYVIWLRRLDEQSRSDDKHKLSMDKYDEAVNRGFGRGTAFEKQLDRYREDFMQKLWQKHNKEVMNAR